MLPSKIGLFAVPLPSTASGEIGGEGNETGETSGGGGGGGGETSGRRAAGMGLESDPPPPQPTAHNAPTIDNAPKIKRDTRARENTNAPRRARPRGEVSRILARNGKTKKRTPSLSLLQGGDSTINRPQKQFGGENRRPLNANCLRRAKRSAESPPKSARRRSQTNTRRASPPPENASPPNWCMCRTRPA